MLHVAAVPESEARRIRRFPAETSCNRRRSSSAFDQPAGYTIGWVDLCGTPVRGRRRLGDFREQEPGCASRG